MQKVLAGVFLLAAYCAAVAQTSVVAILPMVENQIRVGKMNVNLPPGSWRVLASDDFRTSGGDSQGRVERKYLVKVNEKNQLEAAVGINASASSSVVTSWNDAVCDRKDTLWIQELDGNFKYPACLLINHITPFWTSVPTNSFDRQIFDWYRANKVELPKTALFSTYRKYFSGDFIYASYWINPELLGFAPDTGTAWQNSNWHPGLIKDDPAKVKYVEDLKAWSKSIAASHRNSLIKGEPVGEKLAAFPVVKN